MSDRGKVHAQGVMPGFTACGRSFPGRHDLQRIPIVDPASVTCPGCLDAIAVGEMDFDVHFSRVEGTTRCGHDVRADALATTSKIRSVTCSACLELIERAEKHRSPAGPIVAEILEVHRHELDTLRERLGELEENFDALPDRPERKNLSVRVLKAIGHLHQADETPEGLEHARKAVRYLEREIRDRRMP